MIVARQLLKSLFSSSNPLIRRASYDIIRTICVLTPDELCSSLPHVSMSILTAIGEKDVSCQSSAWSMVLVFVKVG